MTSIAIPSLPAANLTVASAAKRNRNIYWISTGLIAAFWLLSTGIMFTSKMVVGMAHLGFPDYFRFELIVAKTLGLIAVLAPGVPLRVRDWAYSGYGIVLISAFIAHVHAGDPLVEHFEPLIALVVLIVSNVYLHRLRGPA
jgi:uncharacterized membrane protein YhaH (DUF805 family)